MGKKINLKERLLLEDAYNMNTLSGIDIIGPNSLMEYVANSWINLVTMFLMFIGGLPVGTAGGIKTTIVVVLLISALSVVKGKEDVTVG